MECTFAFELSGEHDTLPYSEAIALMEIYSKSFKELHFFDQCLIVEAKNLDAGLIASRAAMTHRIIEVLAICKADLESVSSAARSLKIPNRSYRIRARTVKGGPVKSDELERVVGRVLHNLGYKADLSNPEIELRAIITSGKVVMGIELASANRSDFEDRRPHLKAFFYPGVLMPRMGRALVNISQAKESDQLLDPFSGTGGILVEACLVGIKGIGLDVQRKLVRGARANLDCLDCTLIVGDAKRLPLKDASIDNAVLDTPYGRSAIIEAKCKDELLDYALSELYRVLKPSRRMVIVADSDISDHIIRAKFSVIEHHKDRVHRSLTRQIFVCVKQTINGKYDTMELTSLELRKFISQKHESCDGE
jgi:tRNA (guanine10-N2)-dimethyltransferase